METQTVRIFPGTKQKYVLVRIIRGGEETLLLWGNPNIEWHKDIVQEMTDAGHEVVEALGGGWLMPRSEEDVVYVWGKSDRLGPAPINLVRELLENKVREEEPE